MMDHILSRAISSNGGSVNMYKKVKKTWAKRIAYLAIESGKSDHHKCSGHVPVERAESYSCNTLHQLSGHRPGCGIAQG